MKILYIATERQAAQGAAHSLRGIAPDIRLSWARGLTSALRWLHDNPDVAAIVVEADAQRQGGATFAENVRALAIQSPVVVVAHQQADLPGVVTLAIDRTRAAARNASICTALQSRLFELEASSDELTAELRGASAALAEACGSKAALEQEIGEVERARDRLQATADDLDEQVRGANSSLEQLTCIKASLEHELSEVRAKSAQDRIDFEKRLAARDEEIGEVERERARLQATTDDLRDRLRNANSRIEQISGTNSSLQRELDEARARSTQARTDFEKALAGRDEEIAEVIRERDRLQRLLGDRDAALSAETTRHAVTQQSAQHDRAQAEERIRVVTEAGRRQIERLQQEIESTRRELKARQTEADALRTEMTRIPVLEMQLEQGQKEARRQFERAPYPLCRCTRDGRLVQVNHSFARLLGYRKADDLRDTEFTSVFECANDLRWLIERSASGEGAEAVETTWKTADRRRIHVRLHARMAEAGTFDVAVENLTGLREVEERLRHAQRMEAVGRLASEVAVTCESLLQDGEVSRVSGLLRQFAVYGDQQVNALEPVSVQRVLRDLGPVLKRLAGDDVRVVLPKTSAPFDVDVDADRVERILVNVASYARARMPDGGRVKIDLATTVLDRRFLARHPNVRPGTHVLLTVSEVRSALRRVLPIPSRSEAEPAAAAATASGNQGLDLGTLLGLIADSEGHLWMAAEPSGNMTLKIYLPSREVLAPDAPATAAPAGRSRQLARWFGN